MSKYFLSKNFRISLLLLLISGIAMTKIILSYSGVPNRDPGFLLYMGQHVLHGTIPYRDIWDHKPPGTYYINAAAVAITPSGRGGMWLIEFISLTAFLFLIFFLLRRLFGNIIGIITVIFSVLTLLPLLGEGDLTEEFPLPLDMLCIFLFYHAQKAKHKTLMYFFIGLLSGAIFLMKQNTIGVFISIAIYETIQYILYRKKQTIIHSIALCVGLVTPILGTIYYLFLHHALAQFYDGALVYNVAYSHTSLRDHIKAFVKGFLWTQGVFVIAIVGWIRILIQNRRLSSICPRYLFYVAAINLVVESLASSISGKDFPHYYMTWLPGLSILFAYGLYVLFKTNISIVINDESKKIFSLKLSTLMSIVFCVANISTLLYFFTPFTMDSYNQTLNASVTFLRQNSKPTDTILLWGAETGVNYIANRASPTRYAFQYALYIPGYQKPYMVASFLQDIRNNKPLYIIFTYQNFDVKDLFDKKRRATLHIGSEYSYLPQMQNVYDYIQAHYHFDSYIGKDTWTAYKINTNK